MRGHQYTWEKSKGTDGWLEERLDKVESQLSQLEAQEDVFWRQRAKQHWLRGADANTHFYHRYASARKKRNCVSRIMNDAGVWVEGEAMNRVVLNYFKAIFASGVSECVDPLFDDFAPRVSLEQNNELLRPFVPEEVKTALFSMFPDKAPGPDGMNPGFYQHFWDVVRGDVSQFVVNCLNNSTFLEGLNDTNVVLIPKKAMPETVADLRPIALGNVLYRIMAKMITNRMKPLMGDLISESQSAFIPEGLSLLLQKAHMMGYIHGCRVARGAPPISHLFFADNSLLFFRANVQEATVIKQCLNRYENLSGQKVNFHKSNICFSRNTQEAERLAVADCLQVDQAPNFGKYLGLPSFVGRNKKAAFAYVEDKIRQRIGSWNKKLLSQADSVTLSIERTMNRYWWGSGTNRRIHWKAWDKLCVPKNYGGLGFKDLRKFNLAMLGKQGWRFLTNPNTLVAKVYKARYYPNTSFVDATIGNCPSYCWRSIMAAHDIIVSGVRRRVGNGKSTLIWGHPWLPDDPSPLVQTEMPIQLRDAPVAGLIDQQTNTWDPHILSDIFIPEDVNRILMIPVSPDYEDSWYWLGDPRAIYSVRNAYRKLVSDYAYARVLLINGQLYGS
ncbi:PREDICTED: uncharacterized protein LOC109174178 [Ipomoea nil]|uniref:uncharacterized protein LOC109174178 n=1 Tax=Ipomoea nil TaxID=35883 RepID=UPI0009015367|nr:PREDICTED: uncharacterized protein LOC109174178 [Ipomoea nil]